MPSSKPSRTKISYSAPVVVSDSLGDPVKDLPILSALSEMSCMEGTVVEYLDNDFPGRDQLRGGYLRLVLDGKRLLLRIEIDSPCELDKAEVMRLKESLDGQVSDGIGEGGFDFISQESGVSVEAKTGKQSSLAQEPGEAWQPEDKAAEAAANKSRCAAAAAAAKDIDDAKEAKRAKSKSAQRDPKKLYKLIQKAESWPPPDGIEADIAAEIDKLGGNLSFLTDRGFPFVNLQRVEVLRLLLEAKMSPDLVDNGGHHLLFLAACHEECCRLLLDHGSNVNHCHSVHGTALMRAAGFGYDRIVQLLLDRGADPHLTRLSGKTALDHAEGNKHRGNIPETIALLKRAVQK